MTTMMPEPKLFTKVETFRGGGRNGNNLSSGQGSGGSKR